VHEQEPAQWLEAVIDALAQLSAQLPTARFAGIAVTSTSGTLVLTDAVGVPLRPAIMWDDTRAQSQAEELSALMPDLSAHTGLRVRPSFPLAKLQWLAEQEAELVDRARYVLHESDWLLWQLGTAGPITDPTNALKTGYDPVAHSWDPLLARRGWLDRLPEVVPAGTIVGALSGIVADRSGIPAGVPLVIAMTDANTASLAAGVVRPGQWSSTLGTGLSIKARATAMVCDGSGAVYSHALPDSGWLISGTVHCGAAALSQLFGTDPQRLVELNKAAALVPAGGSIEYPLVGTGEFFPFWAPKARSFRVGRASLPEERFRSVLEGVAVIERLAFERLQAIGAPSPEMVTIVGGATSSPLWNTIRASVLQRELRTVQHPETAVGAAITVLAAVHSSFADAVEAVVRYGPAVEPEEELVRAYDEFADRYYQELISRSYLVAPVPKASR
jgi:sugar (pentulose or hexulose) kinase